MFFLNFGLKMNQMNQFVNLDLTKNHNEYLSVLIDLLNKRSKIIHHEL